jgi:hypothetical protein
VAFHRDHNHTHSNGKRCYNCDETGHFAPDCPKLKRQREFVRAAHTATGDQGDADDEEEGDRRHVNSEHSTRDDRSSTVETNHDDHDNDHVIEVLAGDFYEGVEAEASFLASLHPFPLKELNGLTNAPLVPAKD